MRDTITVESDRRWVISEGDLAEEQAVTPEADWSVIELPYVRDIATQAAKRIHRKYPNVSELEDLEQEALIRIATTANLQEAARDEDNIGLLQHRLEQDLGDALLPQAKRQARTISYDELTENAEEDGIRLPYVVIETASADYTRESVETLLPAACWTHHMRHRQELAGRKHRCTADESYLYGLPQRDDAPDPDMPKGSTNKSRGNNLSAYIADIKAGWEYAPLTDKERASLFLAYGCGWTHEQIAFNQGTIQSVISRRIETAVGKIVARLNGGYWAELAGVEI